MKTFRHVVEVQDWTDGRCYRRSALFELSIDTRALAQELARKVFNSKGAAIRYANGAVRVKAHGIRRGD